MQLQLNAKESKFKEACEEKKKYKAQQTKLVEKLKSLNQKDQEGYRIIVENNTSSPYGKVSEKLGSLLDEVNIVYSKQMKRRSQVAEGQEQYPIDMTKAKMVMKSMNKEQQGLVERLLGKLKIEQILRLQSEEQSDQMMQQMVLNQQQLET